MTTNVFEIAGKLASIATDRRLPAPVTMSISVSGHVSTNFATHDDAAAWAELVTSTYVSRRLREPDADREKGPVWVTYVAGRIDGIDIGVSCYTPMTAEDVAASKAADVEATA